MTTCCFCRGRPERIDMDSGKVNIRGLRLHYLRQGEGDPILLLHGWPTHSFIWRNLMPALSKLGTVYALDLPGFGASDKPLDGEYTFTWFSGFVEGFIDTVNLDRVIVIGHDIGAPSGLLWAIRNPAKVRAVVILNAPLFPWRTSMDWLSQVLLRTPLIGRWLVTPLGLRLLLGANVVRKAAMSPDVIDQYQAPFRTSVERRLLRRTILRPLAVGRNNELVGLAESIAALDVPMALIYGAADRLCGRHMEQLADGLRGAVVARLPDCGHYLQEDCPKELEEALLDFLRGIAR